MADLLLLQFLVTALTSCERGLRVFNPYLVSFEIHMVKLTAQLANDVALFVILNCQQSGIILFDECWLIRMTQPDFVAHVAIAIWMTDRTCVEGVNTLLSKVCGFLKLLHISAMNSWVTQ